jgi:hypothetical protein
MAVTSTENRYMDQVSGRTETMPDTDTQSALALAPGEEPPNFLTEDLSVEREWRGTDRTGWPAGPWDNEPDAVMWRAKAPPHYPCQISRCFNGAFGGYVAIPHGHPAHGTPLDELWCDFEVHRGLTFSNEAVADHWVLGFDCGHGVCDYSPGEPAMDQLFGAAWERSDTGPMPDFLAKRVEKARAPYVEPPPIDVNDWRTFIGVKRYRRVDYVREQVESLAAQLAAVAAGERPLHLPKQLQEDDQP